MPLSSGLSIHDDTKHKGSAKRGAANGVAAMNAGGDVIDISGHACEIYNHKGVANGYAGLDASVEIPVALLKTDVANGIAGLDASALLPEALIPGILNKFVASDNVYEESLYPDSTTSTSYVKLMWMTIGVLYPNPATIRVKFQLKVENALTTAYGQIYKNGAPFGTERSTDSLTFVTFSEDLSFEAGDDIELYVKSTNGSYIAYAYNIAVHGDSVDILLGEAIVAGAVGLSNPLTIV